VENPERIWLYPSCPRCGRDQLAKDQRHRLRTLPDNCYLCEKPAIEYIRADLAAPLPRPSDEPLRDAVPR